MNDIQEYLKELGLNKGEIKVYQALVKLGEAPASQIAKSANIPRTTAISILENLVEQGFVSGHKYKGKTFYWVESPQAFIDKLNIKLGFAGSLDNAFRNLYKSEGSFPVVEMHDTVSGIRTFIEKLISSTKSKSIIYTIDSPGKGNYAKVYSENLETMLLKSKKQKDVHTLSLIPHGSFKDIADYKLKNQFITIKELPEGIDFSASIWIVGDKLIHFSGNPPFIVAIKHTSIVESNKQLFDYFWRIAKPILK